MKLAPLNRPESLTEMAYRELRDAIIEGRLKLGDQLSEQRLSQMLGISKTPVREALLNLKREGLVVIDPQKATSIFHIDEAEIDQIKTFRQMLEISAAQIGFQKNRTALLNELEAIVASMGAELEAGERATYRKLDSDFHNAIVASSGNDYMIAAYRHISAKIGALRTRAQDTDTVVQSSLIRHTKLAAHVRENELEAFCELLNQHIENTGNDYRNWLAAKRDTPE